MGLTLLFTKDPLNRLSFATYNDLDLPETVKNASGNESEITYRADGLWKSITDHRDKTYKASYLRKGQRNELTFPDAAKAESVFDANNLLIEYKPRGGQGSVTYSYNNARRLIGYSWVYGSLNGTATFGYDSAGRVTASKALSGGVQINQIIAYDGESRVSAFTQNSRTAAISYQLDGSVDELTYPTGMVVKYETDRDGRITAIRRDGSTLAAYSYVAAGRLATRSLANGATTAYTYEGRRVSPRTAQF